jgi:hypothetical protein
VSVFLLAAEVVTAPLFSIGSLEFSRTIDLGTIIAIGTVLVTFLKIWRAQALRDQKIDIILFGTEGRPGLVSDVQGIQELLRIKPPKQRERRVNSARH